MDYRIVDLNEWSRGNLFQFYMDHMRIVMSLTVDIDVTSLKAYSQKQGLDFYPLMLWVVSKAINSHDEFKLGWDQAGNLIRWAYVSPSYTDFHAEDESFTKMVTEYSDDPAGVLRKSCSGQSAASAGPCSAGSSTAEFL